MADNTTKIVFDALVAGIEQGLSSERHADMIVTVLRSSGLLASGAITAEQIHEAAPTYIIDAMNEYDRAGGDDGHGDDEMGVWREFAAALSKTHGEPDPEPTFHEPLIPPGSPMDDDGWNQAAAENCAARFGREAAVETVKSLLSGSAPRAVADLSDDEILDAIVRRFGQGGFDYEQDDDMAPCWPDHLAEDLGVATADASHQGPIMDAANRLLEEGRLTYIGGGMWFAPSPAEWGRILAARLGCPERADEIAAVLKGDEG